MASESSAVVLGEVAAERRPKLDAMLIAKIEGLTAKNITDRRKLALLAIYQSAWEMMDKMPLRHPRDVDEEETKFRVDQHVWKTLLDEDVDGPFPWAGVMPPKSRPHPGYTTWFQRNAPAFEYPPLEERAQFWEELLNQAAYDAQCGPFEVLLPAFAWPLVGRGVLHALLADLPQGMRIATRPVDPERPVGLLNVAMSLDGSMLMETASKLRVARMKSDLVRCFMILRLWAANLVPGSWMPLEEFFIQAYSRDLVGVANLFPGYQPPAPPAPEGFVQGEYGELPAPPVTTPAQQHAQPAGAGPSPAAPSTAAPSAGEQSRGGSSAGPAPRGGSSAGQESRGGPSRGPSRGGPRGGQPGGDSRGGPRGGQPGGPSRGGPGGEKPQGGDSRGGPRGGQPGRDSRGGPRGGPSGGGPSGGGPSHGGPSRVVPPRGGQGGAGKPRERRMDFAPSEVEKRNRWVTSVLQTDEDVRIHNNAENANMGRKLRDQGMDWADAAAPMNDSHRLTTVDENGVRVVDSVSSTFHDTKRRQREDAARDSKE